MHTKLWYRFTQRRYRHHYGQYFLSGFIHDNVKILKSGTDFKVNDVVGPVKDQLNRGICYAKAVTGVVEAATRLFRGYCPELASEEIIQNDYISSKDSGGRPESALDYIAANKGLCREVDYPDEGQPCESMARLPRYGNIRGYQRVPPDIYSFTKALTIQPIICAVKNFEPLVNVGKYDQGVLTTPVSFSGVKLINHSWVSMGYKFINGVLYYKFQNSYGDWWGDGGMVLMRADIALASGILETSYIPILWEQVSQCRSPPIIRTSEEYFEYPIEELSSIEKCFMGSKLSVGEIVLIDGYDIFSNMFNQDLISDGRPESPDGICVLKLFSALSKIIHVLELLPNHLAVAMESDVLTFREIMWIKEKKPFSPLFLKWSNYFKAALELMGIKVFEIPGIGRVDVIGTMAGKSIQAGHKVLIVSPNSQYFQLLSPSIRLLRSPLLGQQIVPFEIMDFNKLFGTLRPHQYIYIDLMALAELKGELCPVSHEHKVIKEEYVRELIHRCGYVENVLKFMHHIQDENVTKILKGKSGEAMVRKFDTTIQCEIPPYMLNFDINDMVYKKPKDQGAEFIRFLRGFGACADKTVGQPPNLSAKTLIARVKKLWEFDG